MAPGSPTPVNSTLAASRPATANRESALSSKDACVDSPPDVVLMQGAPLSQIPRSRPSTAVDPVRVSTVMQTVEPGTVNVQSSRPESPMSTISMPQVQQSPEQSLLQERDPFDYQATVNALTIQFLSEHEETRVAALKWLIMLHQKAPRKASHEHFYRNLAALQENHIDTSNGRWHVPCTVEDIVRLFRGGTLLNPKFPSIRRLLIRMVGYQT